MPTSLFDCGTPVHGRLFSGPAAPSPVYTNDLWFDTVGQGWKLWDGTKWGTISSGGGGGGVTFQPPVDLSKPPVPPAGGYTPGTIVPHPGPDGSVIAPGYTGVAGLKANTGDLLIFDGTQWHLIHAGDPTITIAVEPLANNAGGIHAAWAALGTAAQPHAGLVYATFEGSTYLKIGSGSNAGDWLLVETPTVFASEPEVLAGTATDVAIDPAGLQSRILAAPTTTPANDAAHLVQLDGQGRIAAGFIPFRPLTYFGALDVTAAYAAPATAPEVGSFGVVSKDGTAHASWTAVGVTGALQAGDMLVWNGTGFDAVEQQGNYLPLAGGVMERAAAIEFDIYPGAATFPAPRLDGHDPAKSGIDNFTLYGGTVAIPAPAPITAVLVGAVSGNTATVRLGGGPADKAYTITLTYTADGVAGKTQTIDVLLHDMPDTIANRATHVITGDIVARKAGPGLFSVMVNTATTLTAMTVAIA